MKKRKEIEDCIKQNNLFQTAINDKNLAKEVFAMAEHRQEFWKNSSKNSKEYPSIFIEGYYEIIKELCLALLALDGWKALNHECLFAFIKNNYDNEIDSDFLFELKDLRNHIGYRGTKISYNIFKQNESKIHMNINVLKKIVLNKM